METTAFFYDSCVFVHKDERRTQHRKTRVTQLLLLKMIQKKCCMFFIASFLCIHAFELVCLGWLFFFSLHSSLNESIKRVYSPKIQIICHVCDFFPINFAFD